MAKPDLGFTHEEDSATLGSDMSAGVGLQEAAYHTGALPFSLPPGNKCDKPTCQVFDHFGSGYIPV